MLERDSTHIQLNQTSFAASWMLFFLQTMFYFGWEVTINLMRCFILESVFFNDGWLLHYKSPVCLAWYSQEVFKTGFYKRLSYFHVVNSNTTDWHWSYDRLCNVWRPLSTCCCNFVVVPWLRFVAPVLKIISSTPLVMKIKHVTVQVLRSPREVSKVCIRSRMK